MNPDPQTPTPTLRDLADTLEMWANMLREHCDDPANGLPSPCLIDDWMSDYRDAWAAQFDVLTVSGGPGETI